MTVLDTLVDGVRADLAIRMQQVPPAQIKELAAAAAPALDPMPRFTQPGLAVIAEVKRASPSKGALAPIADPAALATHYQRGGAAAISVLTEQRRFSGSLADLDAVRAAVTIPVLRKDFTVDEYMIYEARAHGADLILLIVAALDDGQLRDFSQLADDLGMTALVEVHSVGEAERALAAGATLMGVNNRDLTTLIVDTSVFGHVVSAIPDHVVTVAESGLLTPADAAAAAAAGANVVLVGEALVRDRVPEQAVADMVAAGTLAREH